MECEWEDEFCLPELKFYRDQNSQTEFSNEKCPFHLLVFLLPVLSAWIAFDPIFQEETIEMERGRFTRNFLLRFMASHLLQLSTNRRVNGKQLNVVLDS